MNLNDDFDDNYYDDSADDQYLELEPEPQASGADRRPRRTGGGLKIPDFSGLSGNPLTMAVLGLVGGLILGLIFAWGIWPVTWVDAAATHLRPDLRADWLRMTIDSYTLRPEIGIAGQRVNELGEFAPEAMATVVAAPGDLNPETIGLLQQLVQQGGAVVAPGVTDPQTGETPAAGRTGGVQTLFLVACLVTLVLGAVLIFMYLRSRGGRSGGAASVPHTAAQAANVYNREAEKNKTDFTALGQAAPAAQFMSTYLIRDDLFDDSFSIDTAAGEFLGECGVGVADTIGVGEPKRVTAFEVWLFDKNDIQTITKVIMSNHVYSDDTSRDRLSAKGEPLLARPGAETVLETETLTMVARVMEMAYGDGALPANSFFDRITLELAIWQK